MYFNYLYDQFRKASGSKNIDLGSKEFLEDFSNWLKDMQKRGERYLEFLNYLDIDIDSYMVAEIGKGKSDSLVKDLTATIITNYPEGIDRNGFSNSRLIKARFSVSSGEPILYHIDNKGNYIIDTLSPLMFKSFMTQNPYTKKQIDDWDCLHNKGDKNIIVGVFGNIYDKDSVDKINELIDLKRKLIGAYIEDYTTIDDTYCYVIASNKVRKILRK